ncbi:MAG TPA: hypothetical protein VFK06_16175 [Candidatus Angelobacter sp.]|nr:hypothetical protein [Candidatus Angelobacter sp.]
MREIDLDSAVDEILHCCRNRSEKQFSGSRFFFIVGAGISVPVIPTAPEIQRMCKEIALSRKAFDEPDSADAMRCYSYWFDKAFPNACERTPYLKQLMHHKPISPANLRLAHLLQHGSVGNIVVTPNFDDFLARALLLFGASPILCDHPGTIRRLDGDSLEVQILHVHGTYPFYDACNLDVEIIERARTTDTDMPIVSSFLSHLLWQRSPIVIGYSGWERDVIMSAIRNRIHKHVLPVNLYWFCYDRHAVKKLPDWLQEHSQVRFVVPGVNTHGVHSSSSNAPLERTSNSTLDAVDVLTRFISKTNLQSPALFHNPVKYFAQILKRDIYSAEEPLQDHYHLRYLATRVEAAAEWLEGPEGYAKASPSDELVTKVLDANRTADPSVVMDTVTHLLDRDLTPTQRHGVVDALMSTVTQLRDAPTDCLKACDFVLQLTQGRNSCAACEIAYIHSSFLKGQALSRLKQFDLAISEYDKCVEHAAVYHDVSLCSVLADALYCKGIAFSELGRSNDEIAAYEELCSRCSNIHDQHLRQLLAKARTNIGMALQGQALNLKALQAFRQVTQEFGNDESEEIVEPVAKSLVHTGLLLEGEDDIMALDAYNEVLNRFLNSPYEGVLDPVAKALANKTLLLSRLGDTEQAKVSATVFIDRFGSTTDPDLLPVVAAVRQARGRSFGTAGDHVSAIQDFDWIIERLDSTADGQLVDEVALAWANRGVALMLLGRHHDAGASFDEVVKLVKELGSEIVGDVAVLTALRNRAISAKERSQSEEALMAKQLLVDLLRNSSNRSTRIAVASAMYDIGYLLLARNPEQALASFEDLIKYCSVFEHHELIEYAAKGLFSRAHVLGKLGHVEEKLGCYSELIRRFSQSANSCVVDIVANAIFNKAVVQRDDKHAVADALAIFQDLYLYCVNHKTETTLLLGAKALFAQAQLHNDMERYDLEVQRYNELVTLYQDYTSAELCFEVARALYHNSLTFFRSKEYSKVISSCGDSIERLAPWKSDGKCADLIAQCYLSKAHALEHLGHYEDALVQIDAIKKLLAEFMELSNKTRLAQACICEVFLYRRLKRWENMRNLLDEIISTYCEESDTTIREYVEEARSLSDQLDSQFDSPESNS